jgi:hypothetical protein
LSGAEQGGYKISGLARDRLEAARGRGIRRRIGKKDVDALVCSSSLGVSAEALVAMRHMPHENGVGFESGKVVEGGPSCNKVSMPSAKLSAAHMGR